MEEGSGMDLNFPTEENEGLCVVEERGSVERNFGEVLTEEEGKIATEGMTLENEDDDMANLGVKEDAKGVKIGAFQEGGCEDVEDMRNLAVKEEASEFSNGASQERGCKDDAGVRNLAVKEETTMFNNGAFQKRGSTRMSAQKANEMMKLAKLEYEEDEAPRKVKKGRKKRAKRECGVEVEENNGKKERQNQTRKRKRGQDEANEGDEGDQSAGRSESNGESGHNLRDTNGNKQSPEAAPKQRKLLLGRDVNDIGFLLPLIF